MERLAAIRRTVCNAAPVLAGLRTDPLGGRLQEFAETTTADIGHWEPAVTSLNSKVR
jgi:hypothetical protein